MNKKSKAGWSFFWLACAFFGVLAVGTATVHSPWLVGGLGYSVTLMVVGMCGGLWSLGLAALNC